MSHNQLDTITRLIAGEASKAIIVKVNSRRCNIIVVEYTLNLHPSSAGTRRDMLAECFEDRTNLELGDLGLAGHAEPLSLRHPSR